jgi:hypothetical protein
LINYVTNQVIIIEEKVAVRQEDVLTKRQEVLMQVHTYDAAYQKEVFSVLDYVIVYHNLSAIVTKA